MNPKSSRVGGRENMLGMLRYCKQHGVPVLFGSDAHYCDAIGRFQRCEEVCAAAEFPASLRGKRIGFFGELNSKISLQYLEENA